ncbi:neuraminidase-like domain-containing protein [Nodosilinea sp. P-1105]|uniref:Tc toxin subunit A-related protein n=1 Tax=Nodosilinea sp. P-1105 TaxID=2546229 RepID=UPI00146C7E63|nr:neuraminidase-like domain-containing protein [Nodosilinea sp. P-1105]NMF84104.1 hypothetical protein [Nodosilinea sp. P-1105]
MRLQRRFSVGRQSLRHCLKVLCKPFEEEDEEQKLIVKGTIRFADRSRTLNQVTVKAFDKGIRDEALLGEAVTSGNYEIAYTVDRLSRPDKQRADLLIRVFDQLGVLLGTSPIRFNAGPIETIDLTIDPQQVPRPSEFELVIQAITPILQDVQLADLTDEDAAFLAEKVRLGDQQFPPEFFQALRQAAQNAQVTNLPIEVFYGFYRVGQPQQLDELLAQPLDTLRQALDTALDTNRIPRALADSRDQIMERLEQLQIERDVLRNYQLVGQLLNQDNDEPLVGYTVQGFDLSSTPPEKGLGSDITNQNGLFVIVYTAPPPTPTVDDVAQRIIRLQIFTPQFEEIHVTEVALSLGQEDIAEIRIPIPEVPETPSLDIRELANTLNLQLAPALDYFLEDNAIYTLADIRQVGGLSQLEGLPLSPNHPTIQTLDAHAKLEPLSADVQLNAQWVENGYTSPTAIAQALRTDFVSLSAETLGDFKAAQLQVSSRAQTQFLNNVVTGLSVETANGQPPSIPPSAAVSNLVADVCRCKNCSSAVSPAAYLVDLLDYAIAHLKHNNSPITLPFLTETFHQPFGQLPASCASAENQVPQVRLAIEVLRRYLTTNPPESGHSLALAEAAYSLETYTTLLTQLGVSYEDLRQAQNASDSDRQALATRLGITLGSSRPDALDTLLLEADSITEHALERIFGLVDTTRNPLSQGARTGDDLDQLVQWKFTGVEWSRNTDRNGQIYLSLTQSAAPEWVVEVYRDRDRTQLLSRGAVESMRGTVTLIPENNSGLSGYFQIDYQGDSSDIEISVLPQFLSWQLDYLRALWHRQDFPENPTDSEHPLIDPDLIGPGYFQMPVPENPAYSLWQARLTWVDQQLANLQALPRTLDGLNERVQSVLTVDPDAVISLETLLNWRTESQAGQEITEDLTAVNLTLPGFTYLLRIHDLLVEDAPVLDPEWAEVHAILVQVQKLRQFSLWRNQEQAQNLSLSPDHFRVPATDPTQFPPPPPPALPTWRATERDRRNWLNTLQTRIDQEETVISALHNVVSTVEAETLPSLRDGLVLATPVAGKSLDTRAKQLTRQLLIDMHTSGCQQTTRTAQAIATLQNLIMGLRTAQMQDIYPDLKADIDNFDEEWQWIGSYNTWRSAMLVFLYPENVLLPSLRQRQTPAFKALVENLRLNTRLTPAQACIAAKTYADYFQDICTLTVEASCQTRTRIHKGESCRDRYATDYRSLFYMFGRGGKTNAVYWSAYDSTDDSGYAQTFWAAVPGLTNVLNIIGAVPYQTSANERFIYLFVRTQKDNKEDLVFTKYNLEQQIWDSEPTDLDLPESATAFTAVIEQRDDELVPPYVVVGLQGGKVFSRGLTRDGNGWESSDFELIVDPAIERRAQRSPVRTVRGVVTFIFQGQEGGGSYLFVERVDGNIEVGLFIKKPDNTITVWFSVGFGTWVGTLYYSRLVYLFLRTAAGIQYGEANDFLAGRGLPFRNLSRLARIAVHCGQSSGHSGKLLVYNEHLSSSGLYRAVFTRESRGRLTESLRKRITPLCAGPFDIPERIPDEKRQFRRGAIQIIFMNNANAPRSHLTYLEEAYYFVPIHLALQLQSRGHYTSSLDWFRTVYDYSLPIDQRKIYYGLTLEESLSAIYQRIEDWLLDPLNPHAIAATRANTYTRFTLLSLIRCFLEFADSEFARDTAESLPQARTLYLSALDLLKLPELNQALDSCDQIVLTLDLETTQTQWRPVLAQLKHELLAIEHSSLLQATVQEVQAILHADEPFETRFANAYRRVAQARAFQPAASTTGQILTAKPQRLAQAHTTLLTQPVVTQAIAQMGAVASQDYLQTVSVISGIDRVTLETRKVELPWLRQPLQPVMLQSNLAIAPQDGSTIALPSQPPAPTHLNTLSLLARSAPLQAVQLTQKFTHYLPTPTYGFCIAPNPVLESLRLQTELNLYKLRTCRNIAGVERQVEPYAAPTDLSGLPQIGAGGQLVLPGTVTFQPTPYRYAVLVDRAKQLVQLAAQMEAALLSAIEKRDAEFFNLLKARQEIQLTRAGVRLRDLQVNEAESGVRLAELQRDRSQIQQNHYNDLINEGLNVYEIISLALLGRSLLAPDSVSLSVGLTGPSVSVSYSPSGKLQTLSNIFSTLASYERRKQEWRFQLDLARQDIRIGNQQIRIAQDRVRIVGQERTIALIQADNAEDVVDFLANKFTNVELYDWMSNILERAYAFFLQQATAMAKLAEGQLAFERQQTPPPFIQPDYWEAPSDSAIVAQNGNAPDRRGLTGSTRLQQDLYELDQYAFTTNQRKLQITKTISLARLSPAEFQQFRETGIMPFATPMELFDRDFPGHYLRLIRRVSVSVIALIPPTEGIRATLLNAGLSRVVVGGTVFQTTVIRRDPESVALSSPTNATGLFDLEPQPELLFPFEGIGVDTQWEFQMPKAANLFDYTTIADVLVTIEYTALNSFTYRQQVIRDLPADLSSDRPFSFRNELADQWYDLNNPDQTTTPMAVRFQTRREDFPANIQDPRIQQVVLYFVREAGATLEIPVSHLHFTETNAATSVGGSATSIDGIISTRRGNAPSWIEIIGKSPVGEWELALLDNLADGRQPKDLFENEAIEDILLVITYQGQLSPWSG